MIYRNINDENSNNTNNKTTANGDSNVGRVDTSAFIVVNVGGREVDTFNITISEQTVKVNKGAEGDVAITKSAVGVLAADGEGQGSLCGDVDGAGGEGDGVIDF